MKACSGRTALRAMSMNDHQGSRTTALLVSTPDTTLSATNSGSRMGISLLYEINFIMSSSLKVFNEYLNSSKHSSGDVVGTDDRGLDILRVTLDKQLHSQSLVETNSSELGGAVVHQLVGAAVPRQTGHVDQVPLLVVDHVREESLQCPEVGHDVDIECSDDLLIRSVQ